MRRSEARPIRRRGWLLIRGAVNPLTWVNWMTAAAAALVGSEMTPRISQLLGSQLASPHGGRMGLSYGKRCVRSRLGLDSPVTADGRRRVAPPSGAIGLASDGQLSDGGLWNRPEMYRTETGDESVTRTWARRVVGLHSTRSIAHPKRPRKKARKAKPQDITT